MISIDKDVTFLIQLKHFLLVIIKFRRYALEKGQKTLIKSTVMVYTLTGKQTF